MKTMSFAWNCAQKTNQRPANFHQINTPLSDSEMNVVPDPEPKLPQNTIQLVLYKVNNHQAGWVGCFLFESGNAIPGQSDLRSLTNLRGILPSEDLIFSIHSLQVKHLNLERIVCKSNMSVFVVIISGYYLDQQVFPAENASVPPCNTSNLLRSVLDETVELPMILARREVSLGGPDGMIVVNVG